MHDKFCLFTFAEHLGVCAHGPTLYVTRQWTRLILKWTNSSFLRLTTLRSTLGLGRDARRGPDPARCEVFRSSPWEADLLCSRLKTDALACITE